MKNWYKNSIIYKLDVESFYDGNGDGIGDFKGLTSKLNYLAGLGVNCIWLLPFYPSPNRDNGYDVKDYYNIDPRLGNLGDFVEFVHEAYEYGIKIIIDLVVNHTSIEHPWFQDSRSNPDSEYRDYYVWVKEPDDPHKDKVIFEGIEHSIWEYDSKADAYYLHHFFKEQPDLNISNEKVQSEILKIMGFWLELGISGFRIDAAHILTETIEQVHDDKDNLQEVLNKIRDFQIGRKSEAILIGEANVEIDKLIEYFGNKDRMHLLFNFMANKNLFLSLAREDARPLKKTYESLLDIECGEWVNFIRHHDELNLEYLTEAERKDIFNAFAPEENMQIFGQGVRRRLPPMLDGDRQRMELLYSLIFTLKGIPLVSYGEEIGMGEDLSLSGRSAVRTPMQWSDSKNAGFSSANEKDLISPVVSKGPFSYKNVNVLNQLKQPNSFLHWMESLIATRKKCPEISNGEWKLVDTLLDAVFGSNAISRHDNLLCFHNFSDKKQRVTLSKPIPKKNKRVDIFSDKLYKDDSPEYFNLNPYGYRWIKIYD